jgi:hypothetical protein
MPETKTAVEWLAEICGLQDLEGVIAKAKEMEKEQIIDAYEQGFDDVVDDANDEMPKYAGPEQYYNETYGGKQ